MDSPSQTSGPPGAAGPSRAKQENERLSQSPQLARFKQHPDSGQAIAHYLQVVLDEAARRGYNFNASKIQPVGTIETIPTTSGQLTFENAHLLNKLQQRSPEDYTRAASEGELSPHPLFRIIPGKVENWEKRR